MLGLLGNKKIAQLILSEVPKAAVEEKSVPNGIEADFSKAHEALAGDMLDALKSEDKSKFSKALKQFIMLCDKEDDYSEVGE